MRETGIYTIAAFDLTLGCKLVGNVEAVYLKARSQCNTYVYILLHIPTSQGFLLVIVYRTPIDFVPIDVPGETGRQDTYRILATGQVGSDYLAISDIFFLSNRPVIYLASGFHDTIHAIPVINNRGQTETGNRELISQLYVMGKFTLQVRIPLYDTSRTTVIQERVQIAAIQTNHPLLMT